MNLPIENSSFENFPIEFKEINPEDFKYIFSSSGERIERTESSFVIENNEEKIIISPNEAGYINDAFQESIDINHKNTVVVNAAVGQGKSYAIIQTLKKYYDIMQNGGQKYMIFVASPFVSLVKQYCEDIEEAGIPPEQIYSYDNLGREPNIPYLNKAVQVITANTLLGNPGEDGFKNSEVKRTYLNQLVTHCERNSIKVVFVYDEIHDSYHNFKQEYIFNLWKWRNVILKNYVISATYNEASKVVIEYLAEITDFKIQIIESRRVRFPEKQSALHLHYSNAYNFTSSTKEIKDIINELVSKGKNIDVLCYSKTLAKGLIDIKGDIGKLLNSTFGEVKDCTSELPSNQREENEPPKNQYDNTKCNVGTNFKTGVSIKKDNHAFVIIMPPTSTILPFRNMFGIFSGGINSVIQALARQRRKGEIHIVLPKPKKFNYDSLIHSGMSETQIKEFSKYYNLVNYYKTPEKLVNYIKLNRQDFFMREFYENKLRGNVNNEIEYIEGELFRMDLPNLKYPTYPEFKLERGEDYLSSEYPIFGEDVSAYVTYASLTNQFVNCALKEIHFKPIVLFKEGEVQRKLLTLFDFVVGVDYYNSLGVFSNFKMFYTDVRQRLYNDYNLKYEKVVNNKKKTFNISEGSNLSKKFEIQLLKYTYKLKHPNKNITFQDQDYSRGSYFLDCIASSIDVNIEVLENENHKNRVRLYKLINGFREKLIHSLQEHKRSSDHYNYTPAQFYSSFLDEADILLFKEMLTLIKYDSLLENKVFEFKRRFEDNRSLASRLKTFYSMLIEDFLLIEQRERLPSISCYGRRRNVKVVSGINLIPSSNSIINLVESQDYINLDLIVTDSKL